jgi:hypothetical protein
MSGGPHLGAGKRAQDDHAHIAGLEVLERLDDPLHQRLAQGVALFRVIERDRSDEPLHLAQNR